jgi:hypothetical protein
MYYATAHLGMTREEYWLTPFGLLLDLWECHLIWHGLRKPAAAEATIDDIIPAGI